MFAPFRAIAGKSKIDEASLDDIEEALISSDIEKQPCK